MKELISQILDFYKQKMRAPKPKELITTGLPQNYLTDKGCICVTLYLDGEVRGSAGNIKEIGGTLVEEMIASTIASLNSDTRFSPLKLEEIEKLQFRVDHITDRKMLSLEDLKKVDPIQSGAIAIEREYNKLAFILPNISPKLVTGDDIVSSLSKKLSEKSIDDKKYIFYSISTKSETSF